MGRGHQKDGIDVPSLVSDSEVSLLIMAEC